MTVPAFSFLWGRHDEVFHHKRRYTARELKEYLLMQVYGKNKLHQFFIFPLVLLWRSIKDISMFQESLKQTLEGAGILNTILIILYSIEALLIRFTYFPLASPCVATRGDNE